MSVTGKVTRLGAKLGIVGGAFYYTKEAGLWGDTRQTEVLYKELHKLIVPYIKQTPVEVPELPRAADMTRALTEYWNCGVIASFGFLYHLPTRVSDLASTAYNKVNELVSDPSPPSS